ncbi:PadR family transcriptional regulator [Bacillus sp. HY001]|nr:PadR family transcriptional regulator [Bacillus sp. HY001]
MSNRRYNKKIVDISGEIADICEKSLIYSGKYQMGYVEKKLP